MKKQKKVTIKGRILKFLVSAISFVLTHEELRKKVISYVKKKLK